MKKILLSLSLLLSILFVKAQNNALLFDQSANYVNCGNILTTTYTKEAWIRLSSNVPPNNIISGSNASQHVLWAKDGTVSGGNTGATTVVADPAGVLPLNTWFHFAVTYNAVSQQMKLYKNGVLVSSATGVGFSIGTGVVYLGAYDPGQNVFAGQMDEVRIWNTERTAAEIFNNYNKILTGSESGLTQYYNFDQTSGTNLPDLATGNGVQNGTLTGLSGSPWVASTAPLVTNNTLDFDGTNDAVTILDNNNLDMTTQYTFESWIYVKAYGWRTIVSKFEDDGDNRGWMINFGESPAPTDKLCVVHSRLGTWTDPIQWNSTFTPILNTWYHIAVTFDAALPSNEIKLYVNGTLFSQTSWAHSLTPNAANVYLGGYDGSGNGLNAGANDRFFNGQMDEVRIWNTARSAAQIQNSYNQNLTGTESGLVAYYPFNQGIAGGTNTNTTILSDVTAPAENGTLTGFAPTGATSNWVSGVVYPASTLLGSANNIGTGSNSRCVAIGDLNGDGFADLAVANNNTTVSVFTGTGIGTLGAAFNYATGSDSYSVAIGDLNGDGRPDLAVANYGSDNVSVLTSTGLGTFGAAVSYGTGSGPVSVAIGDLNGDGRPDLVTANLGGSNVSVLTSTGSGTFGAAVNYGTGSSPWSVAIGDLNGDSRLDLAVANSGNATVSVLTNTGFGTFGIKVDYTTGTTPRSVAIGNLNNDSYLDLTVANLGSNTVSVLTNTGIGTFGTAGNYTAGTQPHSVAIGDLNGDGRPDLAVANYGSNTVSVLTSTGSGTFGSKIDFATGSTPYNVAIGDLNGDGKLDLATANNVSNNVSVILNTFSTPAPTFVSISNPLSVCGVNGTITANFTGGFLQYQWYRNGVSIAGANTISLTSGFSGAYYVVASNIAGSATSSVTTITACNNALQFNSNNGTGPSQTGPFITVSNNSNDFNLGNNFTIEAWVNPTNLSNGNQTIFSKGFVDGGSLDNGYIFQINSFFGVNTLAFYNALSSGAVWLNSGVTIPNNTWSHVAIAYNGSTSVLGFYVNGVNVTNLGCNLNLNVTGGTNDFIIGRQGNGGTCLCNKFNGQIDEARIWNVARTPNDIQANLYRTINGNLPGLVAAYNFNQGIGGGDNTGLTTLIDQAGGNHNGTLNSFTNLAGGNTSNWVGSITTVTGVYNFGAPFISLGNALSVCANGTGAFTITATGQGSFTYQWFRNGTIIAGQTSATLNLTSALTSATGTYLVQVSSIYGTSTSSGVVFPNCNNALDFDGVNDEIIVGNISQLNLTSNFTAEAWVYNRLNTTGTDFMNTIFSKKIGSNSAGWSLFINEWGTTNGKLVFETSNGNILYSLNINVVPINQWTHIAVSVNQGVVSMYVNGNLIPSTWTGSFSAVNSSTTFRIGNFEGASFYNNGIIDEARIWNISLSQQDIQNNLFKNISTTTPGLVGYWDMNQGIPSGNNNTITSALDKSGNGLNGTLTNFTLNGGASNFISSSQTTIIGTYTFTAPTITGITSSQTVCSGVTLPLSVTATGSGLSYQWFRNNVLIAGATASSLTLTSVTATSAGTYFVSVTGLGGSVTSSGISLGVGCNNALDFDGTNDVISTPGLNIANSSFSFELWAKRNSTGVEIGFFSGGNEGFSNQCYFGQFRADGGLAFGFWGNDLNFGTGLYNDLNWHHYAFTYNHLTNDRKVYRDGVLVGFDVSPSDITANGGSMTIGSRYSGLFYNGNIDEFRVWNIELSQQDIQNNRFKNLSTTTPGLIRYWDFNQGIPASNNAGFTNLNDRSGNNLTGNLLNFGPLTGATSNWVSATNTTTITSPFTFALPVITNQTTSQTVCSGVTLPLSVTATGTSLTYQWFRNNLLIPSATASTLTLTGITVTSAGTYFVSVSGLGGSVTSAGIALGVGCNNALNFAGDNDFVDLGNITALNNASTFTIEMWAFQSNVLGDKIYWAKNVNNNNRIELQNVSGSPNNLYIFLSNGVNSYGVTSNNPIQPNQWQHLAVVYDGNGVTNDDKLKLFINGIPVTMSFSGTLPNTTNNNSSPFVLGVEPGFSPSYFNGSMDEVRIWNVALSATDILANINKSPNSTITGLVATYDFNQGLPNNNNGTINSAFEKNGGIVGTLSGFALSGSTSNWVASLTTINGAYISIPVIATSFQNNNTCSGLTNGSIGIVVSSGTPPYSYNWSPGNPTGNGTATISGLLAGIYMVTVTDINMISAVASYTITQPGAIFDSPVTLQNTSFCGTGNAILSVSGSQIGVEYAARINTSLVSSFVSGNGVTLTLNPTSVSGTTTYNILAQQIVGKALSFNGVNQYIDPNILPTVANNFTVEAWVNPTATHEIDAQSNLGASGTSGQKYILWPTWRSGGAGMGMSVGTNGVSVYEHAAGYMPSILVYSAAISGWTHIAVVYTSKQPRLYINGTLVSTGLTSTQSNVFVSLGAGNNFSGQSGGIGGGSNGNIAYFQGAMDEFRIWNTNLTQSQIASRINTCLVGNEANLFAYYRFDNGSFISANDATLNNYNGAILNMTAANITNGVVACGSGNTCPIQLSQTVNFTRLQESEIQVNGNTNFEIFSNDLTPSISDGTDFGTTSLTGSISKTFTIQNTGTSVLNINNISFSGANAANFSVTSAIISSVANGSSANFTVQFLSTTLGIKNANVVIGNSDCDESVYTFAINANITAAGSALDFAGDNDFVSVASLNATPNFTFEAWVNIPSYETGWRTIVEFENDAPYFGLSSGTNLAIAGVLNDPTPMPLNTWTHVAATYDLALNRTSLFRNGIQVASITGAPTRNGVGMGIGFNSGDNAFKGQMDEVRIWNRALTAAEIFTNMSCNPASGEPNLLARYDFNQGSAEGSNTGLISVLDRSGNGNNGTATNFTMNGANSNWVAGGRVNANCTNGPEINVTGNTVSIANGSATPTTVNGTNFGTVFQGSSVARNFIIENIGSTTLGVSLVSISGANASDFSISQFPSSIIEANTFSGFNILFNASTAGSKTAVISILNNDADEGLYQFTISGTALPVSASALAFDGSNDQVNLGSNFSISGTSMFASQFWFNSTVTGTQRMIFSNFNSNSGVESYLQNGALGFALIGSPNSIYTNTVKSYNDGKWHHAAISYNGNSNINGISIYVDGDLQEITTLGGVTTSFTSNSQNFVIGRRPQPASLNSRFVGQLDNLSFWNTTLTQTQIRTNILNTTLTGTEPNLVAYYNFNQSINPNGDNSGFTTLANQTTLAGANGTLTGFLLNGNTSNWVNSTGLAFLNPTIAGVSGNQTTCKNDNSVKIFSFTATGSALNYQWYENDVAVGNNNHQYSVTGQSLISAGTYTYKCVVSNWLNSATSSGITLTVNPSPTVTGTATPNVVCLGQPVLFAGNGANVYEWSNGILNNQAFFPTISGSYMVTGTSAGNCIGTGMVNITVLSVPTVTGMASKNPLCLGESTTLVGTGAISYVWQNPESQFLANNSVISPTISGTYFLSGTDANGCTINATNVTITVNQLPNITFKPFPNSVDLVCLGQPAILSAEGATTFTFTGGVLNGTSFIPTSTTSYIVSGTDNKGCKNSVVKTVTVIGLPTVSGTVLPSNTVCDGTEVTISGFGANTYTYTGGVFNNVGFVPSSSAIYTITGLVGTGCSATNVVTLTVLALPTVTGSVSPSVICEGETATFSGSGAILNSYTWTGGVIDRQSTSLFTVDNLYTVTGTSVNGCQNSAIVSLTVNSVDFTGLDAPNSVCLGESVGMTASGANLASYLWFNNATTSSINFVPAVATTLIPFVTVTGTNGCQKVISGRTFINPVPILSTIVGFGTYNSSYIQSLSSEINLIYNLNSGATPSGLILNNGSITGIPTVVGLSNFTITGDNGTCSSLKSYSINVLPAPLTVQARDTSVYQLARFPPQFRSSITGLALGDNISISYFVSTTTTNTIGSYTITPIVSGSILSNYILTTIAGTFNVISPLPLTITAPSFTRQYGDIIPTSVVSRIVGLQGGDNVTANYVTLTSTTTDLGTYPVTIGGISGPQDFKYTIVKTIDGLQTVRTRRLTIRTFDLTIAESQLANLPTTFAGSIIGLIPGGDVPILTYELEPIPGFNDRYTITPEVSNINLTQYALVILPGTMYVKSGITIIGGNFTKTYGQNNPVLSGQVLGIKPENPYVYVSFQTVATPNSPVGEYTVYPVITGSDASKYGYITVSGVITVTKANLTVAGANQTRLSTITSPFSFTPVITGAIAGDIIPVDLTTDAPDLTTTGTYMIYPSVSGIAFTNYNVTTFAGTLTIATVVSPPISITVSAGNFSRKYGEADGNYTYSLNGIINQNDNITISVQSNATFNSPIGTYQLTPIISGLDTYKYNFITVAGTLTIQKNTVTVAALDYSRGYGDANPPFFNASVSGLLNGDQLNAFAFVNQNQFSNAGTYDIFTQILGAVPPNYDVVTVAGKLTINRAVLTLIGGTFERMYNQPNPVLAFNLIGYKGADQIGMIDTLPIGQTIATLSTPVAASGYPVIYSGGKDNNYAFVYQEGSIKIDPSTQTITGYNPIARVKTGESVTLSAYATSGLPLEVKSIDTNVVANQDLLMNGKIDGITYIKLKQPGDANYLAADSVLIAITSTSTGIKTTTLIGIFGSNLLFKGVQAEYQSTIVANYRYSWSYSPSLFVPENINWVNPLDTTTSKVKIVFPSNINVILPSRDSSRVYMGDIICKVYDDLGNLMKINKIKLLLNVDEQAAAIAQLAQTLAVLECPPAVTNCTKTFISTFNYGKRVNVTDKECNGGFSDFTASGRIDTLVMGNPYNFKIGATVASNTSSLIFFAIWIDYDNNGSFNDPDDFLRASSEANNLFEIDNLTIRNNDKYEGPRRIRISMKTSKINANESCLAEGVVGETEDYMIYVKKPQALEAATLVTPNADEKNDFFVIRGMNVKNPKKLLILDRWGTQIYKTDDYQNDWDGKDGNGKQVSDGTYYYYFDNGTDENNNKLFIKGFLELKTK
ncbi:MAG: choice-of-anchor D domain-containing protein [Bacteroidetes bacterium]|nr:MAG: choice-of-anchor D domain-containing protein [Bacteroidota bacterium]